MARRASEATPASAATPASGATAARVRRSRSKAANKPTRALLASVDALGAKVALRAADRLDARASALRYLEASRPTSIFAPASMSAEDKTKMAYAQADEMVGVIRAVLDGLNLTDADFTRGVDLAMKALRGASAQGWEPL